MATAPSPTPPRPRRLRRALSWLGHRSNRSALVLSVLLGVAFAISSVYLARVQTLDEYRAIAVQLAHYAVQRTDRIREYTFQSFQALRAQGTTDPCSNASLALMRRLNYGSDLVVDIGYVRDGHLLCSTAGRHGAGIPLPAPDYLSPSGAELRLGVQLPFAGDARYTLSTLDGYTIILRAEWSEDVLGWMPDAGIAIGTLHPRSRKLLFSRGTLDAPLIDALSTTPPQVSEREHLVVLQGSPFDYVGFAVIPTRELQSRWHARALQMMQVGLLLGLLLAALVFWVMWRQTSMPAMIRTALRQDEFSMVYQPVVELATGRWVGLEALMRWHRPDGTMVSPDVFIPAAERSGQISALTAWVAERVLAETRALLQAEPQFHLAINVTGDDLLDGRFHARLSTLLQRHGVAASQLIGEITERVFMHTGQTGAQIHALRALGMRIAIDDFGTGYSSLAYLTRLELDYLKIDKTFVDPIGTGAVTANVVSHIIAMAQSLGLTMIAEGVETEAQADFLRAQGVQQAQGWLFARPMPIEEVRQHMAKGAT